MYSTKVEEDTMEDNKKRDYLDFLSIDVAKYINVAERIFPIEERWDVKIWMGVEMDFASLGYDMDNYYIQTLIEHYYNLWRFLPDRSRVKEVVRRHLAYLIKKIFMYNSILGKYCKALLHYGGIDFNNKLQLPIHEIVDMGRKQLQGVAFKYGFSRAADILINNGELNESAFY